MRTLMRSLLLLASLVSGLPATAGDVKSHAEHAVELGWDYFNRGDAETALKRFNQALILNSDFAPAYFGIAYIYSIENKLGLAIENYRKCIVKDPSFSHAYSNLGLALLYTGSREEALLNLSKALEIDPKNGDAHVNMALYYYDAGDYVLAWKHVHLAQDYKSAVDPGLLRKLNEKLPEPPRTTDG